MCIKCIRGNGIYLDILLVITIFTYLETQHCITALKSQKNNECTVIVNIFTNININSLNTKMGGGETTTCDVHIFCTR